MKIWYEFPRPVSGAEGFYDRLNANWEKVGKPDTELIIKAPVKLITLSEKRLEEWTAKTDMHACIVIAKNEKGLDINYIMINKQQKKALDTIAKRFEETGSGKLPITTSAKKVLIQARDITMALTD